MSKDVRVRIPPGAPIDILHGEIIMIHITPISTYDYDHFASIAKNKYGVTPLEITFPVDIKDKENPKCGNCRAIIKGLFDAAKYCSNCGCRLKWVDD